MTPTSPSSRCTPQWRARGRGRERERLPGAAYGPCGDGTGETVAGSRGRAKIAERVHLAHRACNGKARLRTESPDASTHTRHSSVVQWLCASLSPRTARRSWHRSQRTAPLSPRALRTSPTSSSSPASSSGKKLGGSPPKRGLLAPPPSSAVPSSVAPAAIGLGKGKGCPSRPSNRRAASGSRFSHAGECARGWSRVESVLLGVRTRMRPGVTRPTSIMTGRCSPGRGSSPIISRRRWSMSPSICGNNPRPEHHQASHGTAACQRPPRQRGARGAILLDLPAFSRKRWPLCFTGNEKPWSTRLGRQPKATRSAAWGMPCQ